MIFYEHTTYNTISILFKHFSSNLSLFYNNFSIFLFNASWVYEAGAAKLNTFIAFKVWVQLFYSTYFARVDIYDLA